MSRRKKRHYSVASTGDLIDEVLQKYTVRGDVRLQSLTQQWAKVVGPRISQRSRPTRLRGTELVIEVDNSSWLHQLGLMREQVLEQVQQHDPALGVESLRFDLTRHDQEVTTPNAALKRSAPLPRKALVPADDATLETIKAEAESIEDVELRAIVIDARRKINR